MWNIKDAYEEKKDPIIIQDACQPLPVSARARESIQKKHSKSADVNEELLQFLSGFLGEDGEGTHSYGPRSDFN